ncbi:MAG: hypothetical protein GY809_31940 [Planctomycetes bacterium]|nr:hypothetical protein [Planctomycetota bacterium]
MTDRTPDFDEAFDLDLSQVTADQFITAVEHVFMNHGVGVTIASPAQDITGREMVQHMLDDLGWVRALLTVLQNSPLQHVHQIEAFIEITMTIAAILNGDAVVIDNPNYGKPFAPSPQDQARLN